jgi:hypothetical protein
MVQKSHAHVAAHPLTRTNGFDMECPCSIHWEAAYFRFLKIVL